MSAILSNEVKSLPKVAYLVQEYDEILDMELNVVIFLNSNKADEFVKRAKERDKDDRYYYDIYEVPLNEEVINYLVIARVEINFDGWYRATEDYILGHSQSKMIADSYAATLNKELDLYKEGYEDSEIITDYRFLWTKGIIDEPKYEYYKDADEIMVDFMVVETSSVLHLGKLIGEEQNGKV